uniref:Bifunctional lysine-specific demethylase and histidyl-hydroxylase NO66 n=3 Tax=Drosophila willistoni TaxID=7260 RepID=NO66_DROWI|nr:RecName: Full=Bifunctional lysine-specific demethylase and histidyl-hydroxylase NO66; AltName: Full=Histone lysine demethylase NO66 [Drosophila willistoni]
MDPETLDDLVNELFDKKKQLTVSQKQQREKLQAYMMAQLEGSSSASDDDDEDDGEGEDDNDSNSDEDESGSESDATSADDSFSSDDNDDDDSGDEDGSDSGGSDSDLSFEDDSDYEDSHSTEDLTEYTINSENSSVEPTPPKRLKAGDKRPCSTQEEEESEDDNNNKPTARKLQMGESATNGRIQQRKSMVEPATTSKPASCPLTRKSLPANGSAAKSCPLPPKNQKQSAAAKSCPLPPKEKKLSSGAVAKSCPLPPKNEKPSSSGASCPLPSKTSKQVQPRVCQLSDKPKSSSSQSTQKRSKNEAAEGATDTNGRQEAHRQNSIEEGRRILSWVLNPIKPDDFFKDFWEKNACQVQRNAPTYFSELISFEMIDQMMLKHHLEFTTNIDVTSYKDGRRETLNPEGRAMPPTVWGFYGEGCSIRILNPSTYLPGLRTMCSLMQEFFHCLVGANVYLTPPNSQGFAPHFDDIEAFVLQVEGRKRWRLYMPLQPSDVLARESSGNYTPDQLGEPIFDEVLKPGDVLYFPRGTVHQAITEKKHHSLHITLSVYQQQAYANLLEKLMPMVLQSAIKHSVSLRRGLPLHTWQHLGIAHGATKCSSRSQLIKGIQEMVQQHLTPSENQIDAAVDQLAKRYQHEALPPTILPEEKLRTVFGSRSATDAHGKCLCDYELTEDTSIRLLRANILRLVVDETHLRVYYYVDNALEYCKYEANFMEIEPTEAAAVETLMHAYPAYVKISMLPLRKPERRIEVATALWERGLLMTETPFK